MLIAELRDRVLTKLGETTLTGADVEAAVPSCLNRFAESIAGSSDEYTRQLLKKDFTVTITSGTGDLTAAVTASEPLLIDKAWSSNFYITSGTTPLQPLPDRTQLGLTRSTMVIYYTIDKLTLRTRNTDGLLTSLGTTVTITGSYVPTLANVPSVLTDDLVDVVIQYLAGQATP